MTSRSTEQQRTNKLQRPAPSAVTRRSGTAVPTTDSTMSNSTNTNPAAGNAGAEEEPLLGQPGDATQKSGDSMVRNLIIGTAVIAQAGIWILTLSVWGSILTATPIILFHAHPLLNSAGILLLTQAILVLQPTHTATQKITGTYWHSGLNGVGFAALLAGLIVIEYNKGLDPAAHWHSVHAYLGVATYVYLAVQSLIGATAFYLPGMYGSVSTAKSFYKYHRASGYLLLVLLFVTVGSATFTDFSVNKLHVKLWAVIVASAITLIGVIPRVKKSKLGF